MVELVPFAFEERLVRVVNRDGEPWFVGRDVCQVLDIRNESDALGKLDADERSEVAIPDPSGTKFAIVISEAGVYRLVFRSRKPEAERFKRWLAHDVLPQLRKTGSAGPQKRTADAPRDAAAEGLLYRLNLVREARLLFGPDRARALWRQVGLPAVPPPPATARDEAFACLRHLLDSACYEDGPRVRDLLALALEGDEEARLNLVASGVRPLDERDAFVVANRHPRLDAIFARSAWAGPLAWMRVLRRLPGSEAAGPFRWCGPAMARQPVGRGTVLPGDLLDETA